MSPNFIKNCVKEVVSPFEKSYYIVINYLIQIIVNSYLN
jgi:hypothetical protein